jgi:hypothetical protein
MLICELPRSQSCSSDDLRWNTQQAGILAHAAGAEPTFRVQVSSSVIRREQKWRRLKSVKTDVLQYIFRVPSRPACNSGKYALAGCPILINYPERLRIGLGPCSQFGRRTFFSRERGRAAGLRVTPWRSSRCRMGAAGRTRCRAGWPARWSRRPAGRRGGAPCRYRRRRPPR